jgi:hypothetical protein
MRHHSRWFFDNDNMSIDILNLHFRWLRQLARTLGKHQNIAAGHAPGFVDADHAIQQDNRSMQLIAQPGPRFSRTDSPQHGQDGLSRCFIRDYKRIPND